MKLNICDGFMKLKPEEFYHCWIKSLSNKLPKELFMRVVKIKEAGIPAYLLLLS